MNILAIGGYLMTVGDGSPYWTLPTGDSVRVRECMQDWFFAGERCKATIDDLLWADSIVCYSYGMATLKELLHDHAKSWPREKRWKRLIVVAGVPDFWMQQLYVSLWHAPEFVDRAFCFQVNASPRSCPLQNPGTLTVEFGEPIPDTARFVNIYCDCLFRGKSPIDKHVAIKDHPAVLDAIRQLLEAA